MRALLLLVPLLLAACAGEDGAGAGGPGATAPAKAPAQAAALALPLRLIGTEPFWGATISETTITLSGADRPELRAPAGERRVTGAGASWRTRTASAPQTEITVTLLRAPCSDGMSDRAYPFAATVTVGAETLRGCALTEAEFVRSRP
jgi:uncharacterized membrane protein